MKRIIGWAIFIVAWMFIAGGIVQFGFKAVLLPGLSASAVGFLVLGAIYWIRYANKQEVRK